MVDNLPLTDESTITRGVHIYCRDTVILCDLALPNLCVTKSGLKKPKNSSIAEHTVTVLTCLSFSNFIYLILANLTKSGLKRPESISEHAFYSDVWRLVVSVDVLPLRSLFFSSAWATMILYYLSNITKPGLKQEINITPKPTKNKKLLEIKKWRQIDQRWYWASEAGKWRLIDLRWYGTLETGE